MANITIHHGLHNEETHMKEKKKLTRQKRDAGVAAVLASTESVPVTRNGKYTLQIPSSISAN